MVLTTKEELSEDICLRNTVNWWFLARFFSMLSLRSNIYSLKIVGKNSSCRSNWVKSAIFILCQLFLMIRYRFLPTFTDGKRFFSQAFGQSFFSLLKVGEKPDARKIRF